MDIFTWQESYSVGIDVIDNLLEENIKLHRLLKNISI